MIIALQNSTENDTLTRSLSSKRWSSGGSLSRFCPYCCEETERSSDSEVSSELLNKLILKLHKQMTDMQATLELERSEVKVTNGGTKTNGCHENIYDIWFPHKISDLDMCFNKVLTYGVALDADHPGFKDKQYRERRKYFADIAYNYKHGDAITRAEYTEVENKTWGRVFTELLGLYPKYACKEYLQNLQNLRDEGLYCKDLIPQLEDVSKFLKERTGFQIRPVAGYLSSRDFLSGLAFRTFACTQYIRHSSDPFYTPEPDCCHELLGHVPMFADKSFAQFSQEIGLASLGASDDDIEKLASCYFFSIEFGLCRQNGLTKVYGAGLMSSISEITHAMDGDARIYPFSPEEAIKQECRITTFQDAYFVTPSFAEAKRQMREYAGKIERPFTVRYDPYTQGVEVLSSVEEMVTMISGLKDDLGFLALALVKIQALE